MPDGAREREKGDPSAPEKFVFVMADVQRGRMVRMSGTMGESEVRSLYANERMTAADIESRIQHARANPVWQAAENLARTFSKRLTFEKTKTHPAHTASSLFPDNLSIKSGLTRVVPLTNQAAVMLVKTRAHEEGQFYEPSIAALLWRSQA